MSEKVRCGRSVMWMAMQTEEYQQMVRRYLKMQEYSHLCPCPKQNGGWGYREECKKCGNAVLVKDEE